MAPTDHRRPHRFGGDWTTKKLDVVARYLASYTTALKRTRSEKIYIDAFAGTGYRQATANDAPTAPTLDLLTDLVAAETQGLLEGSAKRALQVEPRFDKYVFIERSERRCRHLETLTDDFPEVTARIQVIAGDANAKIHKLCAGDWRSRRAVMFVDPYGMQVEWSTIEAIARTKAIDLWLLFPLGIGVNRLLTRSGKIPETWKNRLDRILGATSWQDELYEPSSTPTLFGDDQERVIKASMTTIGRYFNQRLAGIFAGCAREPGVLRNSRNNPLYLLCFAAGNERGKEIALRIAGHLLKDLR